MSDHTKKWVIRDADERIKGPYGTKEILEFIRKGILSGQEMISPHPEQNWIPISKEPEFFDQLLSVLEKEADPKEFLQPGVLDIDSEKILRDKKRESAPPPSSVTAQEVERIAQQRVQQEKERQAQVEAEAEAKKKAEQEKAAKKQEVIDLTPKKDLVKKERGKKMRWPLVILGVVVALLAFLFFGPGEREGRIRLKRPITQLKDVPQKEKIKQLRRVRALLARDSFEANFRAYNILTGLVSAQPKGTEARSLLCLTYRELWPHTYQDKEDVKVFTKVARRTSALDPGGKYGQTCEAALALSLGEFRRAQNVVEAALPQNVRDPVFYEMRAELWAGDRKFTLAIDYLKTIESLAPNWIKPYRLRGEYLTKLGKVGEALQMYRKILEIDSKNALAKVETGVLRHKFYKKEGEALKYISAGFKETQRVLPSVALRGYVALAEIYLQRGDEAKSKQQVQQAYQINPRHRDVRRLLEELGENPETLRSSRSGAEQLAVGEQYERQGDCVAAYSEYRVVFESNPKNAIAAFKAARCLWRLSQAKEALEWLDKAIKADPKYIEAYATKAQYYTDRFDYRSAGQVLKQARGIAPKNHLVYQKLAYMQLKRNDFNSAIAYAERAMRLYETDVESLALLVEAQLGLRQYAKAYEKASQLRALDQGNTRAQTVYTKALAAVQGLETGLAAAKELVETYPQEAEYRILYADFLMQDELFREAEGVLRQWLQIEEGHKPSLLKMGEALQAQGRIDEARDALLAAAAKDPSDAEALFLLGRLYLQANKAKQSLSYFERVLRTNPLYPQAHYYSGLAALRGGDLKRALQEADKESRLNPRRAEPHLLMGEIHYLRRQYSRCIASYQKATQLRQVGSDVDVKLARCYRLLGDPETALSLLKNAELKGSGNPDVWKEMGAVCEMKGDVDCAVEAYRQYFILAPNAPDKRRIEGRILNLQNGG